MSFLPHEGIDLLVGVFCLFFCPLTHLLAANLPGDIHVPTLTLLITESQLIGSRSQITPNVGFCHESKPATFIKKKKRHHLVNINISRKTQDSLEPKADAVI